MEVIDDLDQADQPSTSSSGHSTTSGSGSTSKARQVPQPERKPTIITKFLDVMTTDEASKLDGLLSRAIYASNTPFNIVENDYWKEFFKALRPSYKLPSRYEVKYTLHGQLCFHCIYIVWLPSFKKSLCFLQVQCYQCVK